METFKQYFVEKRVLGLEETIYIDGIGDLKAKLDTGNGAFNVLHGEDVKMSDDKTQFKTVNDVVMELPVEDTVDINVGAGYQETRPVVLMKIKVGDNEFNDVPFSIGNRSKNVHKVLISKNFIQNELDALIDVSLVDVADENIEAEIE